MVMMLQADSSSAESSSSEDSSSAYETDSESPDSKQLITSHLFVTGECDWQSEPIIKRLQRAMQDNPCRIAKLQLIDDKHVMTQLCLIACYSASIVLTTSLYDKYCTV